MGRPPMYVLCVYGYQDKKDLEEKKKMHIRKKIIEILIPRNIKKDDEKA